jgi:predicted tellurium resistance membrane protein TerC
MEWITNPESLVALLTLTALEIVLGVDNVIFLSILPASFRPKSAPARGRSDSAWRWSCASACSSA